MPDGFFLEKLCLKNFRNHSNTSVSLDSQLVVFIGKNGVGKTSLIEAISLSSILKSFRARSQKDVIAWNREFYTIDLEYRDEVKKHIIHMGYGLSNHQFKRSLLYNGKKIDKVKDFVGKFQTVFFSPDDILIVDTSSTARRQFFDMLLSSIYPDYLSSLQAYQKMLRMRSIILRRNKFPKVDITFFKSIDKQIAEKASFIQKNRELLFQGFQEPFTRYIKLISDDDEVWNLVYEPSIVEGVSAQKYFETLQKNLNSDLQYKRTGLGVHRDQIKIFLKHSKQKKLDLRDVASQGQKRTVALALKMAQYEYTKKKINRTPVLLIDDVLNELDVSRKSRFISFLNETGQALITTTDLFGMEEFIKKRKKYISVLIYSIQYHEDKLIIEPERI